MHPKFPVNVGPGITVFIEVQEHRQPHNHVQYNYLQLIMCVSVDNKHLSFIGQSRMKKVKQTKKAEKKKLF